jgi:hypothetical protein
MEVSGQVYNALLYNGGMDINSQCAGVWVHPMAGLDVTDKRKYPSSARNRTPVVQPVAMYLVCLRKGVEDT